MDNSFTVNTYGFTLDINYSRPETEEEQAQRAARDKRIDDEEKSRKLEQFEKLKKELGL